MKRSAAFIVLSIWVLGACRAMPPREATPPRTPFATSSVPSTPPAASHAPYQSASPLVSLTAGATTTPTGKQSIGDITKLLPDKAGYEWQYNGFAEYAAKLKLKSIVNQGATRLYAVEGTVADMSGGESQRDFNVRIVYTTSPGVLSQQLAGTMAMDRTLPSLDLIRTPLKKGTSWKQTVRDSTGRNVNLVSTITDVRQVNGRNVYFVYYKAEGGEYYEKRELTEGMGVTAYDKLYMYDSGREEIGYRIVEPQTQADITGWDRWLPRLNYEYTYFGLAEYGHKGSLTRISTSNTELIYDFNGRYDDATGDSSRFAVRYRMDLLRGTVTEQVLVNERGKAEVNSKLHNLVILKFPLGIRQRWSQMASLDGKKVAVRAEVIEYDEGRGIAKVQYTAQGAANYYKDTYIEIRTFEVGYGMTGFGCLLPGDIGITKEEAAYADRLQDALNQHMFGYSLNKTLVK